METEKNIFKKYNAKIDNICEKMTVLIKLKSQRYSTETIVNNHRHIGINFDSLLREIDAKINELNEVISKEINKIQDEKYSGILIVIYHYLGKVLNRLMLENKMREDECEQLLYIFSSLDLDYDSKVEDIESMDMIKSQTEITKTIVKTMKTGDYIHSHDYSDESFLYVEKETEKSFVVLEFQQCRGVYWQKYNLSDVRKRHIKKSNYSPNVMIKIDGFDAKEYKAVYL